MDTTVKITQIIANIAQIGIVVGIYFAWKQARIAVKDIRVRSAREAGTVAISQAEVFAKKILPEYGTLAQSLVGSLSLSLNQYRPGEIFGKYLTNYTEDLKKMNDKTFEKKVYDFTNDLECTALTFTKGIADEEIVFNALAKTYCEIVESLYFFYCNQRSEINVKHYQSTVDLYSTWKQKLKKVKLEEESKILDVKRNALDKEIESTKTKTPLIQPLGKDFTS